MPVEVEMVLVQHDAVLEAAVVGAFGGLVWIFSAEKRAQGSAPIAVPAPTAALIRPDGHVAWVGEGTDQGLRDALSGWFGPRR